MFVFDSLLNFQEQNFPWVTFNFSHFKQENVTTFSVFTPRPSSRPRWEFYQKIPVRCKRQSVHCTLCQIGVHGICKEAQIHKISLLKIWRRKLCYLKMAILGRKHCLPNEPCLLSVCKVTYNCKVGYFAPCPSQTRFHLNLRLLLLTLY
jgi:hypothetical protein